MNCEEIKEMLFLYHDHELTALQKQEVTKHFAQCTSCEKLNQNLLQIHQALSQLPKVNPPFSIVDRLMSQITEIPIQSVEKHSTENVQKSIGFTNIENQKQVLKTRQKLFQKIRFNQKSKSILAASVVILILLSVSWQYGFFPLKKDGFDTALQKDMISPLAERSQIRTESTSAESKQYTAPLAQLDSNQGKTSQGTMAPNASELNSKESTNLQDSKSINPRQINKESISAQKSIENQDIQENSLNVPSQITEQVPASPSNPNLLISQNGKYLAKIEQYQIIITDQNEEKVYFRSAFTWSAEDTIMLEAWSTDAKLTYSVVKNEVVKKYLIDIVKLTEVEISNEP